jgi:hypothetical protein
MGMFFRGKRVSWTMVLLVLAGVMLAVLVADYIYVNFIHSGSLDPT